jgi:hypothetical protein
MINALMPGEHDWMKGKMPSGQPLQTPQMATPAQAPKKRNPVMNALSAVFEYGAPEAFQQGYDRRTKKELGNMLASGDVAGAGKYAYQRGQFEAGDTYTSQAKEQETARRQQEAQGIVSLFSNGPQMVNQVAMEDPAGFERMTGMTADEYLQAASRFGDGGAQFAQYALAKAQAELGQGPAGPVEGKVVNNRLVDPFTGEVRGDYSDPEQSEYVYEVVGSDLVAIDKRDPNNRIVVGPAPVKSPLVSVNAGDTGAGQRPIVDNPSKGYQRVWDEEAQTYRDVPIPGSPDAISREEDAFREYLKLQTSEFNYDNVTSEIDRAIQMTNPLTAGVGGALLRDLPMTTARNLNNAITMVKSNLGFDRLQQMREESKTGGALGAVTEKEIDLLQSTVQRLDQLTDPAELVRALEVVKEQYIKVQTLRQQMYAMKYSGTAPGQSRGTPAATDGVASEDLPPGFEIIP